MGPKPAGRARTRSVRPAPRLRRVIPPQAARTPDAGLLSLPGNFPPPTRAQGRQLRRNDQPRPPGTRNNARPRQQHKMEMYKNDDNRSTSKVAPLLAEPACCVVSYRYVSTIFTSAACRRAGESGAGVG